MGLLEVLWKPIFVDFAQSKWHSQEMAQKQKTTLEDVLRELASDVKEWARIKKHGIADPGHEDGVNLNLVRQHIIYGKGEAKRLCKEMKLKCPTEAKVKVPPTLSYSYCAPNSPAGPCKKRRGK